jgi:hypothetical protein
MWICQPKYRCFHLHLWCFVDNWFIFISVVLLWGSIEHIIPNFQSTMNPEMIDVYLFIYRPDRRLPHVMNDSFRSWRQFPSHLDILRLALHCGERASYKNAIAKLVNFKILIAIYKKIARFIYKNFLELDSACLNL